MPNLMVMNPRIVDDAPAMLLARDGYTKDAIGQHLFLNARVPLSCFRARTVRSHKAGADQKPGTFRRDGDTGGGRPAMTGGSCWCAWGSRRSAARCFAS